MALLVQAERERPRAQLQRKCACGGKCADCKSGGDEEQNAVSRLLSLQRSAGNGAVAAALAGVVQRQDDDSEPLVEQAAEPSGPTAAEEDSASGDGGDSLLGGLGGALGDLPAIPGLPSIPGLPNPFAGGRAGGGSQEQERGGLGEVGKKGILPGDLLGCRPAPTKAAAELLHTEALTGIIALASTLGMTTLSIWLSYLNDKDPSMPRAGRSFAGSGEIPDGFRDHHKTAEAEKEIVETAARELAGGKAALLPAPGATTVVPVASVIDPGILSSRINDPSDRMGLKYDQPATTIPGNLAGGIGEGGGPGGGGGVDKDTRGATGFLEITRDAAGTSVTIKPKLTFKVHDTVDFCPGNLGGLFAQGITVPMSILEATENRFGPVYAADVPLDVEHPGPGTPAGPFAVPKSAPTPPPPPLPNEVFPKTGPAKTTGTLLRVRTGPSLTAPTLRLIELEGTDIEVINQVHGDPVDGNDVWDQISDGFVSDRFVEFQEVFVP